MRNFFTWFIATLLFGLCILENESRKNAVLPASVDDQYRESTSGLRSQINQSTAAEASYQDQYKFASGSDLLNVQASQLLPADSLRLSSRL